MSATPNLETGEFFDVKPYSEGYTIYTKGGWGLGYTFLNADLANAACRSLNDNASLDFGSKDFERPDYTIATSDGVVIAQVEHHDLTEEG